MNKLELVSALLGAPIIITIRWQNAVETLQRQFIFCHLAAQYFNVKLATERSSCNKVLSEPLKQLFVTNDIVLPVTFYDYYCFATNQAEL